MIDDLSHNVILQNLKYVPCLKCHIIVDTFWKRMSRQSCPITYLTGIDTSYPIEDHLVMAAS